MKRAAIYIRLGSTNPSWDTDKATNPGSLQDNPRLRLVTDRGPSSTRLLRSIDIGSLWRKDAVRIPRGIRGIVRQVMSVTD